MVSFTITAGLKRWYVVGSCVPPNDQPVVHRVEQSLAHALVGVETLLVGYLNARLAQPRYQQEEDLEIKITNYGLVNESIHLITRQRYRGKGGWP